MLAETERKSSYKKVLNQSDCFVFEYLVLINFYANHTKQSEVLLYGKFRRSANRALIHKCN